MRTDAKLSCWAAVVAVVSAGGLQLGALTTTARSDPSSTVNSDLQNKIFKAQAGANNSSTSILPNEQVLYLVRSTILMLDDANQSGNYTVMKDLASPEFQKHNSAADLANIFSDLRKSPNGNLSSVAVLVPTLSQPATIASDQTIRLKGHFATVPLRVEFDLAFRADQNKWRLTSVVVGLSQPPLATGSLPETPPRAATKDKKFNWQTLVDR